MLSCVSPKNRGVAVESLVNFEDSNYMVRFGVQSPYILSSLSCCELPRVRIRGFDSIAFSSASRASSSVPSSGEKSSASGFPASVNV